MRILRCSAIVVFVSFFTVLGTAQPSHADPITYSFSGVLDGCIPPCGTNNWPGRTVVGQFTFDSLVPTLLTEFSFRLEPPDLGSPWRVVFPDPPQFAVFVATPTELSAIEVFGDRRAD